MIGSLNKSCDCPIIVSAEDLKSLSDLLSSGFEELQYTINTKDGAKYTITSLEDVLNYSNTDDRKIQRLCVRGNILFTPTYTFLYWINLHILHRVNLK